MRLRLGNFMIPLPRLIWQRAVAREGAAARRHLRFMTADHHRVRNFVVEELPRAGAPLAPELIAERLELSVDSVVRILERLERGMTFLFRNPRGEVEWAYPITVADTPFRYLLDNGEAMTPAWGVDAIATPFVQGRLRNEKLSGVLSTTCAHCDQSIEVEVNSDMGFRVITQGATPLISTPMVNLKKLKDPSIVDAFWRKSLFFWSEEHAREHKPTVRYTYATLEQAAYLTPIVQGGIFGFDP